MTPEFEQKVADALWDALGTSPIPPQSPPSYVGAVRALAPRIAAAIAAGGRVVADGFIVSHANWEAALAALRDVP